MIRFTAALVGAVLLLAGTACGPTRARAVPDVTGQRLDIAEDTLDELDLRYHTAGGGAFGIVVRSHWVVCEQDPPPGTVARSVLLTVARSCAWPDASDDSYWREI